MSSAIKEIINAAHFLKSRRPKPAREKRHDEGSESNEIQRRMRGIMHHHENAAQKQEQHNDKRKSTHSLENCLPHFTPSHTAEPGE
jgi:hypothetical protein